MKPAIFSSLIGYRFHQLTNFFRIAQEVIIGNIQVLVELEYIRNGSRKIQFDDIFIRNMLQMFNDTSQTIAMRDNQQGMRIFKAGNISDSQYGIIRSMVSFNDSVRGSSASGTS